MTDNKANGSRANRSRSSRTPAVIDQEPIPFSQENALEDKESATESAPGETITSEALNNDIIKNKPLPSASRGVGPLFLAAVVGSIAGAAINVLMPIIYPASDEFNTRLTGIERSLSKVPLSADVEALRHMLDDLRRQNAAIGGRLSALEEKALEVPVSASSDAERYQPVAHEMASEISVLQENISRIDGLLAGIFEQLQKTDQSMPGQGALKLQTEQEALSRRLSEITESVSQVEIQTKKLSLLEGRLAEVEDELQAVERTTLTMEASNSERLVSLARLAVFERMHDALEAGKPFAAELETLARLNVPESSFSALQLVAGGLATPQSLAANFSDAVSGIEDTSILENASLLDKLVARASQIVRVRRVDAEPDIADLARQVGTFLASNNASGALALWERLPQPMRDKTRVVADALKMRIDAQEELASMTRNQIQALGAHANPPGGE